MNSNYADLQIINEALGGIGDTVTKYIAARRTKQREDENLQAIRDFLTTNADSPMVKAAGLTPQAATILGGKNPMGVMGVLKVLAEANTPTRTITGGTKEGRKEVLTPRYGEAPSKVSKDFLTEPTNEPDTGPEYNMKLAKLRLISRGVANPSDYEVLEEARNMQLELAQTQAMGRSDITTQNQLRKEAIDASQQLPALREQLRAKEKEPEPLSEKDARKAREDVLELKTKIKTFEKKVSDYKKSNPAQKDISYNTLPNGVQYRVLG